MGEIICVAVGGSIGAVSRYWLSQFMAAKLGSTLPYGTFIVNVIGCLIIGILMTLTQKFLWLVHTGDSFWWWDS